MIKRAGLIQHAARVGALAFSIVLGISAAAADAVQTVAARSGNYPGYGRLVFDLPKGATFEAVTEGDRVLIVFAGADGLDRAPAVPRNVAGILSDGKTTTLTLKPGSRAHTLRTGNRLIVDAFDPDPRGSPTDAAAQRAEGPQPPAAPKPRPRASVDATQAQPSETVAAPKSSGSRVVQPNPAMPEPQPSRPASPAQTSKHAGTMPPGIMPLAGLPGAKSSVTQDVQPGIPPKLAVSGLAIEDKTEPARPTEATTSVVVQRAPVTSVEQSMSPAEPAPSRPALPSTVLLAADTTVGAAAFRSGDLGIVVLDRRLPLKAPAELDGATVIQGAVTTMLQMPLAPDTALKLSRVPAGWTVELTHSPPSRSLQIEPRPDGAAFSLSRAGRVVTVLSPQSGGTLLVGTSLAGGPGTAIGTERHTPEFSVLPTWLGVVVEPASDHVDLRAGQTGFALYGAGPVPPAVADVSAGRRFDLPNEAVPALMNRLRAQLASAAAAPPRARSSARLAAAEAMLALGMGVEAEALIQDIVADDPQSAADANVAGLGAIAAVVAGRLDEAAALDDARLENSPEIALWRGLRDRRLGKSTEAARGLPGASALALAYPEPLRHHVWPDIAEAAVDAGVPLPGDSVTPFAQAMLLERGNKLDEALAAWQAIAAGPDRLDQVRATVRAAELSLAAGRIGPGEAADVFERQMVAWRGDERELALRLRAAELRAAAGGWRAALDLLRATDPLFPDQQDMIRQRKGVVFEAMLAADGGKLSPLDVVLLATDYADCIPSGTAGAPLAALLADKLVALDLPARAIPVLQGLLKASEPGPARAELGARLAQLLMDGGDAGAALTTLQASAAPGLSPTLLDARGLVMARALAAQDKLADAVSGLTALGTPAADDLRASLLAKAGDWPGSLAALSDLAAKIVPATGPIPDAGKAVLLRQASAAAQIPDVAALHSLEEQNPRMTGASADVFRMLTQPPVRSAAELPRAAKELTLARMIPQRLQQLTVH